jgi:glycosyltransferase involved in cell wall biosynthesis
LNRAADAVVSLMNLGAAVLSHRIVAYTQDYADHSTLLRRFPRKIKVIPPPVVMPTPDPDDVAAARERWRAGDGPVIGSAARLATEKGVEYLVGAIPELARRYPGLRVLFAGQHDDVVGESAYKEMLDPLIAELGDRWLYLGVLHPDEMPEFFGVLDALVVSSINSTESFGLVQVEAMLCGTPVVATDLPGVRQPIAVTGMGVVVPARSAPAIAAGVTAVLEDPQRYRRPRAEVLGHFDITRTVAEYEQLFDKLRAGRVARE